MKTTSHTLPAKPSIRMALTPLLAIAGLGLCVSAQADAPDLVLHLDLGAEHDSNLSLVELDKVANESDWATTITAGVNSQWAITPEFSVRGGLQYDDKRYQQFDEFDLGVARAQAEARYDFSWLSIGGNYHQALARLDGQQFLELGQSSLFASKLIGHTVYVRGQLTQQEKNFRDQPERNADNQGWESDAYWFTQGGQSYLHLGLGQNAESARVDNYSYDGHTLRLGWSRNFKLADYEGHTQLAWRYVVRDYDGPAQSAPDNDPLATDPGQALSANRADTQQHWEAKWQLNFSEAVSLAAKLSYSDYSSNYSAADYRETVTSLQLKTRF